MSLPLPRLALALAATATACAATATRNGLPDFDSQFGGQVLSYKRAAVKEVKEKVVEGVKGVGSVASSALGVPKEGGKA
ncbi:hypothetical protein G7Y79_00008g024690 [Physcia stellaris]|nr:hypothetical protein G7Y79_00008g024690 [Physcia stellaris]